MSLLFMDSFDHIGGTNTNVAKKWDFDAGIATPVAPNARTGTAALQLANFGFLTKLLPPGDVFILGCAMRFPHYGVGSNLLQFMESAIIHVAVTIDASGFLVVKRGATVLATATSHALAVNSYYYVEVKVVIHDTTGSVVVHVDGATPTFNAALTGIDTQNAGTGVVDRIALGGVSNPFLLIDDLYICDDAGSVNNDFLGICVVERLLPSTGNGTHVDFTPSTGTDHGALVDENPPNDDTDYVSSDVVGHQDSYQYPSLALTGAILGLQTNLYAKKTDVGARSVAPIVRVSGTTTYAGTAAAPTTNYKYLLDIRELNPLTGVAWTAADIAALEVGMKVVS